MMLSGLKGAGEHLRRRGAKREEGDRDPEREGGSPITQTMRGAKGERERERERTQSRI